jgi:hypothetical protein
MVPTLHCASLVASARFSAACWSARLFRSVPVGSDRDITYTSAASLAFTTSAKQAKNFNPNPAALAPVKIQTRWPPRQAHRLLCGREARVGLPVAHSAFAARGIEQRLVLLVAANVSGGIGAEWNHRQARLAGVFQGCFDQFRTHPAAGKLWRYFRVRQDNRVVLEAVVEPRHRFARMKFKAASVRVVQDLGRFGVVHQSPLEASAETVFAQPVRCRPSICALVGGV